MTINVTIAATGFPGRPINAALPKRPSAMGASETTATRYPVTAAFSYKKKTGRREWVRATLSETEGAGLSVQKFRSSGAGILTSMVAADGLVELPEDIDSIASGDVVQFLPFNEVSG